MLSQAGLRRVHGMVDPVDALDRLDEVQPDLVLLDLHMPGLDGYEFLRQVRARRSDEYFPVMVLTGDTSREATRRAFDLGARDFLTKPLDRSETVLRVRNLLHTRYLYDLLRADTHALAEQVGRYEKSERDRHDEQVGVKHSSGWCRTPGPDRGVLVDVQVVQDHVDQLPSVRAAGQDLIAARAHPTP